MTTHLPVLQPDLEVTVVTPVEVAGEKKHISFSELSVWDKCNFRHKLKYIDKIALDKPSEHTEYGRTIHDVLENYLKTKVMPDVEQAKKDLDALFALHGITASRTDFHDTIEPIVAEVPSFMDEHFKDWEYIAAEQYLYENIEGHEDRYFKGYIDGIIRIPKSSRLPKTAKPGEMEYWIIDWKSCSWGWDMAKKTDPSKTRQLALYKHYWSKKLNVPLTEIRCGFILLKRTPRKGGTRCELVPVSVGEKTIQNGLELIDSMIFSVQKRIFTKNRKDCRFCEYAKTVHCP